jgi:hypothetical protein
MTSIQDLQRLNDIAASIFGRGEVCRAAGIFQQVLRMLRAELGEDEAVYQQVQDEGDPRTFLLESSFEDRCLAFSPDNPFPLYPCAFNLPASSLNSKVEMTAILVYNLGLALHCQGVLQAKGLLLQSALKCYKVSISFMPAERSGTFALLYLAACTNQGHIYGHGFIHSEMMLCKDRILEQIHEETWMDSGDQAFFCRVVFDVEECSLMMVAPMA